MRAAAAVYVVAALVLTFPLGPSLTTRLGALQGPGDPYLNLWILGWGLRTWTTDPGAVLSGRVFDANIFHPAEGTLAYSDHFLLQALALSPVYAVTGDAVLCYNLLLLASIALSGLAMHGFIRAVTGSPIGAYAAGLAWACWPYRTAHLMHIQLQALYFMPLALWGLHRVIARRRWRDVLALAALTALQITASVYNGVMTVVALVVGGVVLASATGALRSVRLWSRLAVAGLVAVVLSMPVIVPYLRSQQADGFGRTLYEASQHSASLQAYTQVPPVNLVYGRTGLLDPRPPAAGERDRTHVEHHLFPGFVLMGLALVGAWRHWRSDARPLVVEGLALVVAGLVLSGGPEGLRLLYAALHDHVFGFQAIRAPARFAVVAVCGLALLAALGLRSMRTTSRAAALGLVALMALEYVNVPLPLAAAPARHTEVGQWLAREPTPGAVLHLPIGVDAENTPFMVQSLEHGRPIVNGYSGQRPSFYTSLVDSLSTLPSPEAFALLRELDVRFVVSPQPIAGARDDTSPLVERARLGGGTIYEVRWTPAALAALEASVAPPPPPPGAPPFEAGETIVFDVYWESGPVDLPAGQATLQILEGADGADRWTFEVRAATADWVSTFFQARDRFVTIADGRLLPLEHRREIREGRREVDRRYVYDRAAKLVRTDLMALPLEHEAARDAITALYYVRTLPLRPGSLVRLPLNEGGTNLELVVAVGEREMITHAGGDTTALRLEPRVARRIERRRPVAMTVWVSADARRVPLRAVVDAGFGRIRLEMARYGQ